MHRYQSVVTHHILRGEYSATCAVVTLNNTPCIARTELDREERARELSPFAWASLSRSLAYQFTRLAASLYRAIILQLLRLDKPAHPGSC